ncbi:MAG: hypothetical protein HOO06_07490 [Bdellovibrionaceae bacterium]|jgi:hypothetical protein|nr:hypothetical protein [Pseudobdellovibrionaceae bacterium]
MKNLCILFLSLIVGIVPVTHASELIRASEDPFVQQLKNRHPNAKIKYVSMNEYNQVMKSHQPKDTSTKPLKPKNKKNYVTGSDRCFSVMNKKNNKTYPKEKNTPHNNKGPNFGGTMNYSSSSNKDALVVVAVIGVVAVAALVVYAGQFVYESINDNFKCQAWQELGFRYSNITDSTETQFRNGNFKGIFYSNTHYIPIGTMGLNVELGTFNLNLETQDNFNTNTYSGSYLMLGPSFTFPLSTNQFFNLELLGGTASTDDIGLLSTLRAGYNVVISDTVSLNLSLGAAYIKVKGLEGYLGHADDLNYLSGFQFSFRY